jgi:lycopene beta-cyclase
MEETPIFIEPHNMPVSPHPHFSKVDYLFAGAGASATLLLMSMEQRGLLQGKTILVLDPDAKSKNDKTYCFWGSSSEPTTLLCQHLISHHWGEVSVNRNQPESLFPTQYRRISGLDLYGELRRIMQEQGFHRVQATVLDLEATENGVKVTTDKGTWYSTTVFDSRPPLYLPPANDEAHLLQSFIGYVIDIETPLLGANCIDLMDFGVDQQGHTQFMYVLPFSTGKLLVELTRFGLEPITPEEAEPLLNQYIAQRFGDFQIIETETGCIPMSTASTAIVTLPGVIPIGGRAGAVKPSTGYAFKNMSRHAQILADCLQKGIQPAGISVAPRFLFYDRLLLYILSKQPAQGKPIFEALFQKNSAIDVLLFLDEKTSLYQDLQILFSLPLKPFLQAWWAVTIVRYRNLLAPLILLLLALGLLVIHTNFPQTTGWVQPVLLSLGLFFLGIPHGAVDHLLESGNLKGTVNAFFVIKYLGFAAAFLALWLFFPNLAIFFFLGYSAWHFGQADMQQWQPRRKWPIKNWAWGASLLGIVLFGHVEATNTILANMKVLLLPLTDAQGKLAASLIVLAVVVWGLWERRPAMLLSVCMLAVGIQLPLLTAFGLYFIGQHSFNGWSHLKKGFQTDDLSLFKKAFPFTAGAFLLFGALLYCLEIGFLPAFNKHWVTAFFVFISCISFPHVIAMHGFYRKYFP